MITEIKEAAKQSGFSVYIAENDKDINTQLNRIVRQESLPIALTSWDIPVNLEFDNNGVLKNPLSNITMLLVDKADSLEKRDLEEKAEEVGDLFINFIRNLNSYLYNNTNVKENPITSIRFEYAPKFGSGQHSGVLATFTTQLNLKSNCS